MLYVVTLPCLYLPRPLENSQVNVLCLNVEIGKAESGFARSISNSEIKEEEDKVLIDGRIRRYRPWTTMMMMSEEAASP